MGLFWLPSCKYKDLPAQGVQGGRILSRGSGVLLTFLSLLTLGKSPLFSRPQFSCLYNELTLRTLRTMTSKMTELMMPGTCVLLPRPEPGEPGWGGAVLGAWESQMWWPLALPE